MKTKYKLDAPKIYRAALPATWSVTFVYPSGKSDCYGHFITNGKALDVLDVIVAVEPSLENGLKVYHHYGPCRFCGREVIQDVI